MSGEAHATPLCNTGVHPPVGDGLKARSFFDWYRATVPVSLPLLTEVCSGLVPHPAIEDGAGRFNYRFSRTIKNCGIDRVATILHGGSNGHPNVEASAEYAPRLAQALRQGGPHRVTRCDVAVDLWGEGIYSRLHRLCGRIADDERLGCREIADRDPAKGNTTYLGSRKSAVFARVYEKGKADLQRYAPDERDGLEHWVRVELEVKPQKEMRERAATLEPEQFWGISSWSAKLAKGAFDMSPDPIPFHPRRVASDDRAWHTAMSQYRNVFQRRCENVHRGDRDALAREFLAAVFPDGLADVSE